MWPPYLAFSSPMYVPPLPMMWPAMTFGSSNFRRGSKHARNIYPSTEETDTNITYAFWSYLDRGTRNKALTGIWHVNVTKLMSMNHHREGPVVIFRYLQFLLFKYRWPDLGGCRFGVKDKRVFKGDTYLFRHYFIWKFYPFSRSICSKSIWYLQLVSPELPYTIFHFKHEVRSHLLKCNHVGISVGMLDTYLV